MANLYYWYDNTNTTVYFSNTQVTAQYVLWQQSTTVSNAYKDATEVVTPTTIVLPENISYMFYRCANITTLDLSNWDMRSVTDVTRMFCQCTSLKSVSMAGRKADRVVNMEYMFWEDTNLEYADLSGFGGEEVQYTTCLFFNCTSLKIVNLSRFVPKVLEGAT